jgi:hypothetical protein
MGLLDREAAMTEPLDQARRRIAEWIASTHPDKWGAESALSEYAALAVEADRAERGGEGTVNLSLEDDGIKEGFARGTRHMEQRVREAVEAERARLREAINDRTSLIPPSQRSLYRSFRDGVLALLSPAGAKEEGR